MTQMPASASRRATIGDLATQLGLSRSAVSYALNGHKGVSEQTRTRVLELAQQLQWRPHVGARALRTNRSRTVGMVLAREPRQIAYEPFYSLVLAGIEEVLLPADYSLMLRMVGFGGDDLRVYREWAVDRRVDGVVIFDGTVADPRPALLAELSLAAVQIGELPVRVPGIVTQPGFENAEAELLVTYLHTLGHRRLAHLSGPLNLIHERNRVAALSRIAAELGVIVECAETDYTVASGLAAAAQLVQSPTAIIGSNDQITLGAMRWASIVGRCLPAELSLTSWDDSLACQMVSPAITCLDRHPIDVGRNAARQLLSVLGGSDELLTQPHADLIVRGSTSPPPR